MGNMRYCMFQNTVGDLEECLDALYAPYEEKELSPEESRAAARLIAICEDIAKDFGSK